MLIRPCNPDSATEIGLVAARMRLTLIEVEGEAAGQAMYSMEWLRERVRWHLDPASCTGQVLLAEEADGAIAGHTIVRVELAGDHRQGLFSTTYVEPAARRRGIADALLRRGEQWMLGQGLREACTWTSATNAPLIGLYARHGYGEVERGAHPSTGTTMVKLARAWA